MYVGVDNDLKIIPKFIASLCRDKSYPNTEYGRLIHEPQIGETQIPNSIQKEESERERERLAMW